MASFEEIGIATHLCRAVEQIGWERPTATQAESIPLILGGGDVVLVSETGSGKTGAVCLPLLQIAQEQRARELLHSESAADVTFEQYSKSHCTVSDQTLQVSGTSEERWVGARLGTPLLGGKKYAFGFKLLEGRLIRVGVGLKGASLELGTDGYGFGFGATGTKVHAGKFSEYGSSFKAGDTVKCEINLEHDGVERKDCTVEFYVNGQSMGTAFSFPSLSGIRRVNPSAGGALYPFVSLKSATVQFLGFEEESGDLRAVKPALKSKKLPIILVLQPTLELCRQMCEQLQIFQQHSQCSLSTIVLTGGVSIKRQVEELHRVEPDVVVGTPSRIIDLVRTGQLDVSAVQFFFVDEADAVAENCRLSEMQSLKSRMMTSRSAQMVSPRLQVLLASATVSSFRLRRLIESIAENPSWVDLKGARLGLAVTIPVAVKSYVVPVAARVGGGNDDLLKYIDLPQPVDLGSGSGRHPELARSASLKQTKLSTLATIITRLQIRRALIFVRTRNDADNLERFFVDRFPQLFCGVLHRGRQSKAQVQSLDLFKSGKLAILIATDVAARGIDVSELPCVINMTLPDDPNTFIHRIGRVGRAGAPGLALSLVAAEHKEQVWYHTCKNPVNCLSGASQSNCIIWYDEAACLKAIEALLDVPIPKLSAKQLDLDPNVKQKLYGDALLPLPPANRTEKVAVSLNDRFSNIILQQSVREHELQHLYLETFILR